MIGHNNIPQASKIRLKSLMIIDDQLRRGHGVDLILISAALKRQVAFCENAIVVLSLIETLQSIGCPNALIIQYVLPNTFSEFANQKLKDDIFNLIRNIKNPRIGAKRCREALDNTHPVGFIIHLTKRPSEWGVNSVAPDNFRLLLNNFQAVMTNADYNDIEPASSESPTELPPQLRADSEPFERCGIKAESINDLNKRFNNHGELRKQYLKDIQDKSANLSISKKNLLDSEAKLLAHLQQNTGLLNASLSPKIGGALSLLHRAVEVEAASVVKFLIENSSNMYVHHVQIGYAYEQAASNSGIAIIKIFLESFPRHKELRQGIITHLCHRMYTMASDQHKAPLPMRAMAFLQILDLLTQHYKPQYVRDCMMLNFGHSMSSAFKQALIATAISPENDVVRAKDMLQKAEDNNHPLNFVLNLDESFTFGKNSTARKIKALKQQMDAVVVMDPLPHEEGDLISDEDDLTPLSPFKQQSNGDDGLLHDGVELETRDGGYKPF